MRYIALLRGINVSGQKIIKMEVLKETFMTMGFKNVKTYIQSGNVVFDATAKNADAVRKKIEAGLKSILGHDIPVMLRTVPEFEALVKSNPFLKRKPEAEAKWYVTFLAEAPVVKPKLPLESVKKDVEVFYRQELDVCCLSRAYKGSYGFPNAFIEKEWKGAATTRNWNTVCKLLELAK